MAGVAGTACLPCGACDPERAELWHLQAGISLSLHTGSNQSSDQSGWKAFWRESLWAGSRQLAALLLSGVLFELFDNPEPEQAGGHCTAWQQQKRLWWKKAVVRQAGWQAGRQGEKAGKEAAREGSMAAGRQAGRHVAGWWLRGKALLVAA